MGMTQKLKLELLDDYISLYQIKNFCLTTVPQSASMAVEIAELNCNCQAEIDRCNKIISKIDMADTSFSVFKQQIKFGAVNYKNPKTILNVKNALLSNKNMLKKVQNSLNEKQVILNC